MQKHVIGFVPPIIGVDGNFNTFRMGRKWAALPVGEKVFLMDEKRKIVFGTATILYVKTGALSELCEAHAAENHTELGREGDHAASLYRTLEKIYGPHLVNPKKVFSVIALRRIHADQVAQGQFQAQRGMVRP